MKKFAFLLAVAALVITFAGSCNGNKSAGKAAKQYAEMINDGNYDDFVDVIYFDPAIPAEQVKQAKAIYANAIQKHAKAKIDSKSGAKKVEVVSEKPIGDGTQSNVVLGQTYNNGDTEKMEMNMILDNDNVWKVRLGSEKEVWRTHMTDGSKAAFKLKDGDHREFFKEDIDGERDFVKVKNEGDKQVLKVKQDGEKDVIKVKEKEDKDVIKVKHDGKKEVVEVEK